MRVAEFYKTPSGWEISTVINRESITAHYWRYRKTEVFGKLLIWVSGMKKEDIDFSFQVRPNDYLKFHDWLLDTARDTPANIRIKWGVDE